jgi:uncharacterized protein (DUF305 family)
MTTPFEEEMDAGMARMMAAMHAAGSTGSPDIDFLAMMIPHHAGAVDMARAVLRHGRDPITRQLAEEIIATQTVEIQGMQRRLAVLKQPARGPEFPALGGTRGP